MSYFDDYKGIAHSSTVKLALAATQRLPDHECKFVQLHRWNTSDDEVFTVAHSGTDATEQDEEIYYGFDGVIAGQLFPSQSTALIPVSNTNQITLRKPNKGTAATIFFTYFV